MIDKRPDSVRRPAHGGYPSTDQVRRPDAIKKPAELATPAQFGRKAGDPL